MQHEIAWLLWLVPKHDDMKTCFCASLLLVWCRETDQVVDEHFQEDGPYKPIKFEQKYAKRFGVQYLVNQPSDMQRFPL